MSQNYLRKPGVISFTHYLEYQVLMLTGVYSWYRMFYIILYEYTFSNLITWAWISLLQYFYMQRSYDRLEIEKRQKSNDWYEWIFYTGFLIFAIYCLVKKINIPEYLNTLIR